MKEMYTAPACTLLALSADAYLANSDIEMDDLLESGAGGVSANPEIDIDIPIR